MLKNPGREFRRLLKTEPYVYTTGVYTPIQAKIAQKVGLKAVYISGYSSSVGYLGAADLNLVDLDEYLWIARHITAVVDIPVVADAESGFGGVLQVMRTVKEYWRTGVAAIHIEDQKFPKRCGHLAGREILPFDEAVAQFKAAVRARNEVDPDFVIIARTDAIGAVGGSLEEAIRRGLAYADVGADLIWAEFTRPDDMESVTKFAEAIRREYPDIPLAFNYSSSFRWYKLERKITFKELAELGYKYIFITLGAIHAEMYAVWNFMEDLVKNQEDALIRLQRMKEGHPTESHHKMGDFEYYQKLEIELLGEKALQKYLASEGHGTLKEDFKRKAGDKVL